MSRKGSFFGGGGGSGSRRGSLLGGLGRKGSVKGSVKEQEAEWGAKHAEGDYSRHCRLHDAGRDVLFVMPPDNEAVCFSSRVSFATGEAPPAAAYVDACRAVGLGDGWAARAWAAGQKTAADAETWRFENPLPSVCKMAITSDVAPGQKARAPLPNGETAVVELADGATEGQHLLFVLPPLAPNGAAEDVLVAALAKKKSPASVMGMRTWQVRWFELGTTEVRYYEVGEQSELLRPRDVIPLSEVGAATASDDDKTRLDLHLDHGDFAIRLETEEARDTWLTYVLAVLPEGERSPTRRRAVSEDVVLSTSKGTRAKVGVSDPSARNSSPRNSASYPSVDDEEGGLAHHNKRMSFMGDDTETFAEVARRATSELPPTPPKTNTAALDRARRASVERQTDIWGNPRKPPAA